MPASAISVETLAQFWNSFWPSTQTLSSPRTESAVRLRHARYSVSGEGKCVLHIWSEERNIVRRVLDAEVQRPYSAPAGAALWTIATQCCWRSAAIATARNASSRRRSRAQYQKLLERVLRREYPGFQLDRLSSSPDLEHSISPVYTRGVLRAGQTLFAVLGVNGRRNSAVGRRRPHLRHSLDGLPAPAASPDAPKSKD